VRNPFFLYVHERSSMASGVLTQFLGSWYQPVAYLSKQVDSVAKGWPPCLQALAATAFLVSEAEKVTLRGGITVRVPHSVLTLMEYKGQYALWKSPSEARSCLDFKPGDPSPVSCRAPKPWLCWGD
jgi:hypothetical protein